MSLQRNLDIRDGGFWSRKLLYSIGTSVAIVGGGFLAAYVDGFRPIYETYIGGLMGVLALYLGVNVGNKFVVGKNLAATGGEVSPAPVPAKPAAPTPAPQPTKPAPGK